MEETQYKDKFPDTLHMVNYTAKNSSLGTFDYFLHCFNPAIYKLVEFCQSMLLQKPLYLSITLAQTNMLFTANIFCNKTMAG